MPTDLQQIPSIEDFPEPTAEQRKLPEVEIRALCSAYAERVHHAACIQNDRKRVSMEAVGWFASWDSEPGFAKMEAENAALAKFGLPPRWKVDREREGRVAGKSTVSSV